MALGWLAGCALVTLSACATEATGTTTVPPNDAGAPVFEECTTICLRPSDCAIAYSSDDLCPAGFRCAFRFTCVVDGGGGG
jgi:hypothetical protein